MSENQNENLVEELMQEVLSEATNIEVGTEESEDQPI